MNDREFQSTNRAIRQSSRVKRCYLCDRELGEDPNEIFMAVSQKAMEAQGILDRSELDDDSPVIVILCSRCGFHEGLPTVAELRLACAEMERNEPKQ